MAERTTVTELTQIGVESTPGTAVAANKRLPSLSLDFGIKLGVNAYRPKGDKFPTIHALGKEWTEGKIGGGLTYSEAQYLFGSLLAYAAPVQQASTTAYKWTAAPNPTGPDTVKTFTIEVGSSVRAHKIAHGLITGLTLSGSRDSIDLSGDAIGYALVDGITMTSSPTALEQIPILPKEVSVFLDSTSGGLGTTKLTRLLKWTWTVGSRFNPLWVVDAAQSSFVTFIETPVTAQLKLLVEADANGMGIFSTYGRTGATGFARIAAASSQLAGTAIPYSLQIDQAVQVADVAPFTDEDGLQAFELTFDIVDSATWGKALQVDLINKATAL